MSAYYKPPRDTLKWIGVDLDGTLAEQIWPEEGIGDPIDENVDKMLVLVDQGYKIMIHTSRSWADYEMIRGWLIINGLEKVVKEIQCGKPLYAAYVDDKAIHEGADTWDPRQLKK